MKNHKPNNIVLLGCCSHCSNEFREWEARFIIGDFPMEQFCSFGCTERYLEEDRGEKRAIPLPQSFDGRDRTQHQA